VHDAHEKKAVESALIRSLIKPTDGWVSRNLNRPISTSISRVLAHTAITPNQFTIVTGLIGLSTAWFFAAGGYWNYLIGGALFHLTSVLDGVDGELARLKFKSSPFGQWLDTLVDNLSYLAALGGIITGIYLHGATDLVKWAGLLSVVFALLALGSLYFYLLRFKSGGTLLNVKYSFQEGNSTFDKILQVAGAFGKRDLFALIFFILGIFGKMTWALVYIAIMAFMVFVFSIQAHIAAAKAKR
jgi:phosphatidylglycerophosphate synthase